MQGGGARPSDRKSGGGGGGGLRWGIKGGKRRRGLGRARPIYSWAGPIYSMVVLYKPIEGEFF